MSELPPGIAPRVMPGRGSQAKDLVASPGVKMYFEGGIGKNYFLVASEDGKFTIGYDEDDGTTHNLMQFTTSGLLSGFELPLEVPEGKFVIKVEHNGSQGDKVHFKSVTPEDVETDLFTIDVSDGSVSVPNGSFSVPGRLISAGTVEGNFRTPDYTFTTNTSSGYRENYLAQINSWSQSVVTEGPHEIVAAYVYGVLVDASAGDIVVTANNTNASQGREFRIKNIGASNNVVFTPSAGTVRGSATLSIGPGEEAFLVYAGSDLWY